MFPGDEGGGGREFLDFSVTSTALGHLRTKRERERGGRGREGEREREGGREREREGGRERERERCLASKGILAGSTDDSFATFVC